ncbi:TetR/AcrR family transcriptional regulator [Actinomycetospora aeridis]|uniref:Helix-turn-helix domain-containing protein n=1 Tax=Actinomycetospora aeridis TaxID=3129231 RepID=A0ABU8NEN4_9PSEU
MRADGRRNREQILAAARHLVGCDGAQASLEAIARRACVGSATLHRHFPSRRALLDAVFHDGVVRLCERAEALDGDPGADLEAWLEELAAYSATTKGVTDALLAGPDGHIDERDTCHGLIGDAAARLVDRAKDAGVLRDGVATDDVLALACSLSTVTADPDAARRLVRLAFGGVRAPHRE